MMKLADTVERKKKMESIRRTIDGELNRIAVTDDVDEIIRMQGFLMSNIARYSDLSRQEISENNKLHSEW